MVQYLIIQASEALCVRFYLDDYDLYQHQDNTRLNAILIYFIYLNVLYKHRLHSLRMAQKKWSKHVGVLVL